MGLLPKLNPFSKLMAAGKAIRYGFKLGKYAIDDLFRDKVTPIEGSVVYSDLYFIAEHSGIHVKGSTISNIAVDSLQRSKSYIKLSTPDNFSDKGFTTKIYVSCDKNGKPVGSYPVANYAYGEVGKKSHYGLFYSNCHSFSEKCIASNGNPIKTSSFLDSILDTGSDPTIRSLKRKAKENLRAVKWRLWDPKHSANATSNNSERELENIFQKIITELKNTPLNNDSFKEIKKNQLELKEYLKEVSDENLPVCVDTQLNNYSYTLTKVEEKYNEAKDFIRLMGKGSDFSYNDLKNNLNNDFLAISKQLEANKEIQKIVKKLGRSYISKEKKHTVSKRAKNEVFGIHKSNDISRVLPSELSGLDDETLELLFYAKLLERNLLSYELGGTDKSTERKEQKAKGPIVVSLDTSGSMSGTPLTKARALLFAISKILRKEKREMCVLLFGSSNEIKELHLEKGSGTSKDLLTFLSKGFGGGTDFETPLKRSIKIIKNKSVFNNADILMLTDGGCDISDSFEKKLLSSKDKLGFNIYTILCDTPIEKDHFSDEIFSI